MTRSIVYSAVVALLTIALLPTIQSTAAVHEEPTIAIPGTWYTVSTVGQEAFDFLPITTTLVQNGVLHTRTWDPKDMMMTYEYKNDGRQPGQGWVYRVYSATDIDAYVNWVIYNEGVNVTGALDPGINFNFLVREIGMKNITVTISGLKNGSPTDEIFHIRCDGMAHPMLNMSRFMNDSVFFDSYPDTVSSVERNEIVGIYGLGFVGNVRMKVLGKDGTILDLNITSDNYIAVHKWYVRNETKLGFYNITVEGSDRFGNKTTLRIEIEVTPGCPNPPNCLGNPPDPPVDHSLDWLRIVLPIIAISIVAVVLFTRLNRSTLLNQAMRARIYSAIEKAQGIHFHELMRTLDVKPGVLSHHINILEREKFIKSLQDGTYRRFFLYDSNAELRVVLSNIQEKILALVRKSPGIFQVDISREIGSSSFVTKYHIKILRDAGMVTLERDGKNMRCFPCAIP